MIEGMMSESDKIAGYEPPSVTDLGNLEDITRAAKGSGTNEMQANKT
jgi:hypothetical protein